MTKPAFTILGIDAGTNNLAVSVIEVQGIIKGKIKGRILERSMIPPTLRTLTSPSTMKSELEQFTQALDLFFKEYKITHICAERYMLRRGTGGSAIEAINMMLGIIIQRYSIMPRFIPASQWKNQISRQHGDLLLNRYDEWKSKYNATPHECDAIHIGIYGANLLLKQKPFDFDGLASTIGNAVASVVGTTTKPKKIKRKRRAIKKKQEQP